MPKLGVVIICLILLWMLHKVGVGITDGKLKTIYLLIGISGLLMIPYAFDKIGSFPFFSGLVFIYWLPFRLGLGTHVSHSLTNMYPTEFCMWLLCVGIFIHGIRSKSSQFNYAVSRLPFLPFALLFAGSIAANLVSGNYFPETEVFQIRILCFLPAVLCFLLIYFIKTMKQAEHLVWIFLISSGLLGLIFLLFPDTSNLTTQLSKETGRLMKTFKIPLFGTMFMSAETTAECFTFVIVLSFGLWLNYPSYRGRLIAAAVLVIASLIIIRGQARGAIVGTTCSVIVIQALSLRFNRLPSRSSLQSLLKPAILVFSLLFAFWYHARFSTIESFRHRGLTFFGGLYDASVKSGRTQRWQTAFDVAIDNPFGVGMWGFPDASKQSWAAHNLYLFLWLSFGIIGLIAFFWFFLLYVKACWSGLHSNSPNRRLLCITGIGCATSLLVTGQGSPIYYDPWQTFMVWIPIGISMAVATLPEGSREGREGKVVGFLNTEGSGQRADGEIRRSEFKGKGIE